MSARSKDESAEARVKQRAVPRESQHDMQKGVRLKDAHSGVAHKGMHTRPHLPIATTDDAFLGGRLQILQPREGHRAGLDAIFLAAAVPLAGDAEETVLDVGAGSGVVALALAWRARKARVTGLEVVPELVAIAHENAVRNGLAGRVRFVEGDVMGPLGVLEKAGLAAGAFDHVVANPPYQESGRGRASPLPLRRRADEMDADGLARWAQFFAAMARPGGVLTLIHRADAVGRLLDALGGRFGALELFPLFPKRGAAASRILVRGIKGSRAPLSLYRGLVLHDEGGGFRPLARRILSEGAPLDFAAAEAACEPR